MNPHSVVDVLSLKRLVLVVPGKLVGWTDRRDMT